MPTVNIRSLLRFWAIVLCLIATTGELRLQAQERTRSNDRTRSEDVGEQESNQLSPEEQLDSLLAVQIPDSLLEGVKLYRYAPRMGASRLFQSKVGALYSSPSSEWDIDVRWDSVSTYTIENRWNGTDLVPPTIVDFEDFIGLKLQENEHVIRTQLILSLIHI